MDIHAILMQELIEWARSADFTAETRYPNTFIHGISIYKGTTYYKYNIWVNVEEDIIVQKIIWGPVGQHRLGPVATVVIPLCDPDSIQKVQDFITTH